MQSEIGATPPGAPATPPAGPTPARPRQSRPGASRPNATRTVTIRTTTPLDAGAPARATPPGSTPRGSTPPGPKLPGPTLPVPPAATGAARPPSSRRRDIQGLRAGDHFISSLPFSCVDSICPAFAGTLPTKYDTVHMTPAYAVHVAPAIRYALGALGLM